MSPNSAWPRQVYPLGGSILIILTSALAPLPAATSFHTSVKPTGGARTPCRDSHCVSIRFSVGGNSSISKSKEATFNVHQFPDGDVPVSRPSQVWAYSLTCLKAFDLQRLWLMLRLRSSAKSSTRYCNKTCIHCEHMPYNFCSSSFQGSGLAYKINMEFVPYAIQLFSPFMALSPGRWTQLHCLGRLWKGKGNHPVHTPMLVAMVMWSIIVDDKSLLLRRRL